MSILLLLAGTCKDERRKTPSRVYSSVLEIRRSRKPVSRGENTKTRGAEAQSTVCAERSLFLGARSKLLKQGRGTARRTMMGKAAKKQHDERKVHIFQETFIITSNPPSPSQKKKKKNTEMDARQQY
jgi:hypothetical protein